MTDAGEHWDRSWMGRLTCRYGHRAVFIWLVSIIWIFMGVTVYYAAVEFVDDLFHTYFPVPLRAALWIVPAVAAMIMARSRWEWVSFALLGLGPVQRLVSYWVAAGIHFYHQTWSTAWDYAGRGFVYLSVVMVIWLVSTWSNPLSTHELEEADPDDYYED